MLRAVYGIWNVVPDTIKSVVQIDLVVCLRWFASTGVALLFLVVLPSAYAGVWELNPKSDSSFHNGTFTAVTGITGSEGVSFKLGGLSERKPVIVALDAETPSTHLHLGFLKGDDAQPFLTLSTNNGHLLKTLRSGEELFLTVHGEPGARYFLSVWVGEPLPEMIPHPVMPMSQLAGIAAGDRQPTTAPGHEVAGESGMTMIYVLLGCILVVLVVIAIRMGGRRPPTAPMCLLLCIGICTCSLWPMSAYAGSEEFKPGLVKKDGPDWNRIKKTVKEMQKYSKQMAELFDAAGKATGSDKVLNTTNLKALRDLAEIFGFIDPREKAVQPDYNPAGMPELGGHIYDDSKATAAMQSEFDAIQDRISAARRHLEKNYVVLVKTEIAAGRIKNLADAAAGLSSLAGLAWTAAKINPDDPMNKAEAGFYKNYDAGQQAGLDYLKQALRDLAVFEMKYYGMREYYAIYCQPYYNFMLARYTHKGK